MPISVSIRRNDISRVQASITDRSEDVVRDNAHFMRDYAQGIAPVRTGAFRTSLYVNGPGDESDYTERASAALRLNPTARIVPELRAAYLDTGVSQLRNSLGRFSLSEAIVSGAVEYTIFLEEGTVYMAPRPTLRQAALATEPRFKTDMSKVADGF